MPKLYDTHAHINLAAFQNNWKDKIQQTLSDGVWLNNVGTEQGTSARAVEIAQHFALGVYATVGLHPGHTVAHGIDADEGDIAGGEVFDYEFYKKLAADPKVVGIGECGLDYYRIPDGMTLEQLRAIQTPVFAAQTRLAKELDKALVIHCRPGKGSNDAYDDALEILKKEKPGRLEIHSFTGDWATCERFLALGAYVALNGIITFDKTGTLAEVVKECPLEKMILETDAPYLAPDPYRGKQNEPRYVEYVARKVSELRGIPFESVAEQTTANALSLFKLADGDL